MRQEDWQLWYLNCRHDMRGDKEYCQVPCKYDEGIWENRYYIRTMPQPWATWIIDWLVMEPLEPGS